MRSKVERKYLPAIYKAIRKQFFEFADKIEAGQSIDSLLPIQDIASVIRTLYVDAGVTFARYQERELQAVIKRFNPNDKWVNEINEYFRLNLLNKAVLPISETTRAIVLKLIQRAQDEGWGVDKLVSYIRKETAELSRYRARMIVRTESGRAANLGKWIAAREFTYLTDKVWVSAGDRRVRPQPDFRPDSANHIELNGMKAGLDETFINGLLFPGDPNGPANEVINCRCTIIFKTVKDIDGRPIRLNTSINTTPILQFQQVN